MQNSWIYTDNSCIKKLVCVYTDESDTENCNTLIDYLSSNINLAENNISIIKVYVGINEMRL